MVDKNAKVIWDYMLLHHELKKCDVMITFGTSDIRTAEHAAKLFLDGYANLMVTSGGFGKITKGKQSITEAERYKNKAVELGVQEEKILLEDNSTNSKENIIFTYRLLKNRGLLPKSVLLVHKPYMERRVHEAFKRIWPDKDVEVVVSSPKIAYEDYPKGLNISKEKFISLMVGDVQRIKLYSKHDSITETEIPGKVQKAYDSLVGAGYDEHLLSESELDWKKLI